jgi:proteic killer suppression protein
LAAGGFAGSKSRRGSGCSGCNAATSLTDLGAIRGNRLEALKGDRAGEHSIRINDRWRICFTWRDGNAHEVEIVDYH